MEINDCVEESRGIRWAILRGGIMERGFEEGLTGCGEFPQFPDGGGDVGVAIAEIGSERDGDSWQNFKL